MVKKILVTLIRPRLEYVAVMWSPSTKKNNNKAGPNFIRTNI